MRKKLILTSLLMAIYGMAENTTESVIISKIESQLVSVSDRASSASQYGIAIGKKATIEGKLTIGSIAIGGESLVKPLTGSGSNAFDAIAIGSKTLAQGQKNISIGGNAKSYGAQNISIGHMSSVGRVQNGAASEMNVLGGVAIGQRATVFSNYGVAIADGAKILNKDSINSIALGKDALVGDENKIAKESIALGYKTKTFAEGSIALGSHSQANIDAGKIGYSMNEDLINENQTDENKITELNTKIEELETKLSEIDNKYSNSYNAEHRAEREPIVNEIATKEEEKKPIINKNSIWKSTLGALSIGDVSTGKTRQITSLAAGTEDSDAVNVAQLKAVTIKFGADSGNGKVKLSDGTFNIKGTENEIVTEATDDGIIIRLDDKVREKLDNISSSVTESVKSTNQGIANAIATASLPTNNSSKLMNIATSYGFYKGEHALAVGLSGRNYADDVTYKLTGSVNTGGDISVGAGISYSFIEAEKENESEKDKRISQLEEKIEKLEKLLNQLLK